ncbi:hypothetical protein H6P81_020212 [Aristolochia fimbriata]|uniref:Homeobox domain-containing protein n=1 Tax=Aristolochia fimbriata TaxID=158543 RepID=A0AAV7DTV5_ARIFI|nr:hypothetical protein H6P81_020212 [Aristolochia fimbriata]
MDLEDRCNTGLVLGLGYEQRSSCRATRGSMNKLQKSSGGGGAREPSLTLCLADESYISSNSTVSSFSNSINHDAFLGSQHVKRERETGSEEGDTERHYSSRASDEDEEGSGRKKLRLTKEQSALLEESFKEHSTLNPKQKQALAKQLNLRPRQVEVWFQNRRARTKLKQTEVDCEFLKRCCESLTDENRRLQKELQELKALKFASQPFYMQLPAATLTMCPSCERIGGGAATAAAAAAGEGGTTKSPFTVGPRSHFYNPFTHPSAAC